MKFEEVLPALREGKKIRLAKIHKPYTPYIYFYKGDILDADDNKYEFCGDEFFWDWEILPDKPVNPFPKIGKTK